MNQQNPYTYCNLWTTPILLTTDPEYNARREGLIKECMEYYDGQNNVQCSDVIKSRMYESSFNFFDVAQERNYENIMYIETVSYTHLTLPTTD